MYFLEWNYLKVDTKYKFGLFFPLLCNLWQVQIIGYIMAWRLYSFICILQPEGIEHIKCLVRYILSKIKYILSIILSAIYGAVYFSLPNSLF